MPPAKLDELAAFVSIARHRSFQRAGIAQGVSSSALSHAMRSLEGRLQIRLLNRTTRSVSLTEAGRRLFDRVSPALAEIGQAVEELNLLRDAPVGTIRLNMPRQAARLVLAPILPGFRVRFPEVAVDVVSDDRTIDIAAEGFDAGVRFGETLAQDMIAIPFGPRQRFIVVGAPAYFATRPMPGTPADLRQHECIRYRYPSGRPYRWEFARAGEPMDIEVSGGVIVEDNDLVADLARRGLGLGYVYHDQVREDLLAGTLVSVLDDWCPPSPGFFLYYPSRRNVSFAFRAFIEFVRTQA